MSTTYSGNAANNPTSITIPADGDDIDASSVNVGLEGLMDKAAHILEGDATFTGDKTIGAGSLILFAAPHAIDVEDQDALQIVTGGLPPTFTRAVTAVSQDSSGAMGFPVNNGLVIGRTYYYPLTELPNGCAITSLTIVHNPDNATAPTAKVKLGLYQMPLDGSAASDCFTPIEDPATGGSYTAAHSFTATPGSPVTIDLSTKSYWLKVVAETGGGALPGVISAPPSITYTSFYIDLGK